MAQVRTTAVIPATDNEFARPRVGFRFLSRQAHRRAAGGFPVAEALAIQPHNGDVPCNGCNSCCYHPHIDLTPDDDLTGLDTEIRADGKRYLKRRPDGGCVHLAENGGCGVYDHRPAACRVYDCRLYQAFGLAMRFIGDRIPPKWIFWLATADDRQLSEEIKAAHKELPAGMSVEESLDFMVLRTLLPEAIEEIRRHPGANLMKSVAATMQKLDKLSKS